MNKPTFQEIEEAIRTLASAGMLLNAEQTITVNRVLQEMDQQDEEETCWQMEEDSLHQAEIQRSEREARMIEKERLQSRNEALTEYDNSPVDGLWQIFKQPWLHKTFKKRLCESGMRESLCDLRITHLKYKIAKIDGDKTNRKLVENCSTIAEMRKLMDFFIATWQHEERFAWYEQFFHEYLSFLAFVIFRPDTKKSVPVESVANPKTVMQKIKLTYSDRTTCTFEPFEALCYVTRLVGVSKVDSMQIHVGSGLLNLMRKSEPANNVNYQMLESNYWIKSNCTPEETLDVIRQIIVGSGTAMILNAQLTYA